MIKEITESEIGPFFGKEVYLAANVRVGVNPDAIIPETLLKQTPKYPASSGFVVLLAYGFHPYALGGSKT